MNLTDVLIILLILLCCWAAYRRGFILSTLVLMSWMAALVIAFFVHPYVARLLARLWPGIGSWSAALALVLLIIVLQALFDRLIYTLTARIPKRIAESHTNHILGILPGLANGYIWATLLAAVLLTYPLSNMLTQPAQNSSLASQLAGKAGWLTEQLSPVFAGPLLQLRENKPATVSHEQSVRLPFRVTQAQPRADLDAAMLQLVNQERTKRGLKTLKADPELTIVARAHSLDMLQRGYFSHYTPEGKDPFDRMRNGRIKFLTAGENLAITQTLKMAHEGLMKSPGHRANILNPAFGRVGIGILDAGIHGIMTTQNFRN